MEDESDFARAACGGSGIHLRILSEDDGCFEAVEEVVGRRVGDFKLVRVLMGYFSGL